MGSRHPPFFLFGPFIARQTCWTVGLFGVEIIVDEEVSGAADDDGCGEEARVTGVEVDVFNNY